MAMMMRAAFPLHSKTARALATIAVGAQAVGSVALGALAVGAVAIGALAIGRLAIRRARLGHVEIDELVVRRLRVIEELREPKSDGGSAPEA